MRPLLSLLSWLLFTFGCACILWPLPAFLFGEAFADWYLRFLWRLPPNDKSAGAALPFFWMFITAPLGVAIISACLGFDALVQWLMPRK